MKLSILHKDQLKYILSNYYVKYLSQNNPNRHYIIKYNKNTFTNTTFENNKKLGQSNGKYKLIDNNGNTCINVKYENVFTSPHKNSAFNKNNDFFPKLSNYTIGPFYTRISKEDVTWLPILYNHLQMEKGFKVLNFYKY